MKRPHTIKKTTTSVSHDAVPTKIAADVDQTSLALLVEPQDGQEGIAELVGGSRKRKWKSKKSGSPA